MTNESILGIFAKSPFVSLQKHMDIGKQAAIALQNFLTSAGVSDWSKAKQYRQEIIDLEHAADDIKNQIRTHLPKSLFMSVSREDLLDLVYTMDGIPNTAKDISGIMIGRQMEIPNQIAEQFSAFVKAAIKAAKQASAAIEKVDEDDLLSKLIETSIYKDKPIIVINKNNEKIGVITQSDLLRAVVEGNEGE